MSVFIRPDAKDGVYSFRFNVNGRRFSGSTGKTNKREAEKYEAEERTKISAVIAADEALFGDELTLEQASCRWWTEIGQHRSDAPRCEKALAWLLKHFGGGIMLHDITQSRITQMVAKRRGEYDTRIKHGERRLVGPATVNRTATEPLRQVIVRARDTWEVKTAKIKWGKVLLDEPKERVREATVQEETAIMAELQRGYDVAVNFLFLSAVRSMEILALVWTDVNFFTREFTVWGKRGKSRVIPMTDELYDILWAQRGYHKEYVFTYVARYTRKASSRTKATVAGQRYPLTNEGFATAMEIAVAASGVKDFRRHDTRHTMASRTARSSNLKVVQQMLGHSRIETTLRYVHVNTADVRAAMSKAKAVESYTENYTETDDEAATS